jgi:type VI secretion system secreted protein VgrG
MAEYSQEHQELKIFTDLPEGDLLLTQLGGEEAISRPFHFTLDIISTRMNIDGRQLLRTPAVVKIALRDGSTRTIHGLFRRFAQTGTYADVGRYRAEIVAWPWFLTLRRRRRVFQAMSILEIAEEIFGDWGYSDFEFKCGNRPTREYAVQYDETDWDFISRWLEAEGIFYFFEHSDKGHKLILADANGQTPACPEISDAVVRSEVARDVDAVDTVAREHQVRVGAVALRDYDYLQPSFTLESTLNDADGTDENYDYRGDFTELDDGDRYARYRLETEEAREVEVEGAGNCRWMVSGHTFALDGHFNPEFNSKYLITAVHHECASGGYGRSGDTDMEYRNTFHCIPAAVPYRPLRSTPWPTVRGTQTAVVVGPSGEDVWTDEHGRVKVQFHWDREGQKDENSSCWVRVSSPWAGQRWGYQQVPRLGHEVIVDFIEGDPDRPIITGRVHNADNMPPLESGDNASKSIMRDHAGNEIVFEGKEGSEQIRIYSPYDESEIRLGAPSSPAGLMIKTLGQWYSRIVGDVTRENDANVKETTKGSVEQSVLGHVTEFVTGNVEFKRGGFLNDETNGIEVTHNLSAKSETTIGLKHSTFIGGSVSRQHAWERKMTTGNSKELVDGGKNLKSKQHVHIEASTHITLTVGGAQIVIEDDTIVIGAKKIILNGTNFCEIKSGGDIKMVPDGKVNIPKGELFVKHQKIG